MRFLEEKERIDTARETYLYYCGRVTENESFVTAEREWIRIEP